ncbi:MAG: porin [Bacteroidia bacterium]|jgi:hypothetical protein|nr:porin [Bacteroidia bacterium]
MKKINLLLLALFTAATLGAQTFDTGFSFYTEAYAGLDMRQPLSQNRPLFMSNHHRLNEVAINLVQAEYGYLATNRNTRLKLGLQAGTYVERNLGIEPPGLRNVSEAYAGMRVSNTREIWIDMGIFNSHIGVESARGIDNDMLTRTLMADNSPYYETGVRMLYKSSKLDLGFFVLNGWQNIRRFTLPRTGPSLGTQVQWRVGQFTINSSAFFGQLIPRPIMLIRAFHNLWISYTSPNEKHKLTFAFDAGYQSTGSNPQTNASYWFAQSLIYRGNINEHWSVTARAEAYLDPDAVFISQPVIGAFGANIYGGAAGTEYRFNENFCIRAEARLLQADKNLFETSTRPSANAYPQVSYFDQNLSGVIAICYRIPNVTALSFSDPEKPRSTQKD